MKIISGGVCAAKGFKASGVHCGIRKNRTKRDLALIYSEKVANAAAVYTTNLVKGAPLVVTKNHIADGKAQAVICNSGNANTCNANGVEIAERTSDLLASVLGIKPADIVVASTGVIGQPLNITPIASGIPALKAGLGDHSDQAAEAIMTTDTIPKEIAVSFEIGGVECKMGGIAKGSGMIHKQRDAPESSVFGHCGNFQYDKYRRRHLDKRHGDSARKRARREQRDQQRGRRLQ